MYGFPEELYRVTYYASGDPELAYATIELISREVEIDNNWGIDHGTRSVLYRMYPKADILVYKLSINSDVSAEIHYN